LFGTPFAEEDIDFIGLLQSSNAKKVIKTLLETETKDQGDLDAKDIWSSRTRCRRRSCRRRAPGLTQKDMNRLLDANPTNPLLNATCGYTHHVCRNPTPSQATWEKGCNLGGFTDTWDSECGAGRCHQTSLMKAEAICSRWENCKGITKDNGGWEPRGLPASRANGWNVESATISKQDDAHEMWLKVQTCPRSTDGMPIGTARCNRRRAIDGRGGKAHRKDTWGYSWPELEYADQANGGRGQDQHCLTDVSKLQSLGFGDPQRPGSTRSQYLACNSTKTNTKTLSQYQDIGCCCLVQFSWQTDCDEYRRVTFKYWRWSNNKRVLTGGEEENQGWVRPTHTAGGELCL